MAHVTRGRRMVLLALEKIILVIGGISQCQNLNF